MTFKWDCKKFMLYPQHYQSNTLHQDKLENRDTIALIIANSDVSPIVERAWENSKLHICADGGANRLYAAVADKKKYIPNFIKGDLDSVHSDVLQFYKDNGANIVHEHNQDTTDLEKCLLLLASIENQESIKYDTVLVVGGLGGSFTHEMANCNIVLWSENNAIWLLDAGSHEILLPANTKCGILPVGTKCTDITTTGLKWNLENGSLEFGELVSTSNVAVESRVTIITSSPVLWTMDFIS